MRAMEVITYIMAVLASLVLILGISGAAGAPQEAAAGAVAAAMVIIPYAITATMQRRSVLQRLAKADDNSVGRHV